eukprot:g32208.t1
MCPSAHLLRMLRLHRVPEIVRQHQTKIGFSFALLSLGKFLIVLFFTSHWIACLWASSAWNHPDGSWLEALQGSKSAPSSLYEDWFNDSVSEVAFKRTMDDLNWMMKDREMPKNVRSQLRRYFWESRSKLTDQCLAKVPYLQNLESEVLVADLMDAVRSQKSRSILRWWQIRFAFKCAMVKIGREVSRMQRHQRANFTAMPDELRQSLVCGMLQGQKVEDLFARKSSTCSITSTAASLTSIEPSSTLAVPAGRAGPNQATVLVEADELHKIRLAITSLTQTVEQLQQTVLDMSG